MSIKVMTWNIENLFLPEKDKVEEYNLKLSGLKKVIDESDADIIALQEIGSEDALKDLISKLDSKSWNYEISKFPDGRGIRVGYISKYELLEPEDIIELPEQLIPLQTDDSRTLINRSGRGSLAVTLKVGGEEIRLVNTHLKSKLISYPGGRFQPLDENERARYGAYALYRRAAESSALRTYCNNYLNGKGETINLILLGDMNDEPQAATSQILVGPGGSEFNSKGFSQKDKGDAFRLFNIAPLLPENQNYTRIYRGRGELIDHIYLSRSLAVKVIENSAQTLAAQPLPSITDNPNERSQEDASDHAALVIEINI
jgi:endonuclease/exonuclease/phosphatase family metal-dependent hydrolase